METISDIVREMREFADTDSQSVGRDVVRRKLQNFADRLNTNPAENVNSEKVIYNNAKCREALAEIRLLLVKVPLSINPVIACGIIASKAKSALAAPARNCDVGSLDEQIDRFNAFCGRRTCSSYLGGCPLVDSRSCRLAWSQMPYEEGCAK